MAQDCHCGMGAVRWNTVIGNHCAGDNTATAPLTRRPKHGTNAMSDTDHKEEDSTTEEEKSGGIEEEMVAPGRQGPR